jgi:hypothetical protein
MILAVKDRFSALPDCGGLLKRLSVLPVSMSASENFEGALSTHCGQTISSEADVQRLN